jgi:uncharacterized membrane protein YbhN (UPF0104 family)
VSVATGGAETAAGPTGSRARRFAKIAAWLVGIAVLCGILQLLGFDIKGWFSSLWQQIKSIPPGYLIAGLLLQTGQTLFTGASYFGILHAAYPDEVRLRPIVAAYAVGVAGNSFLPANLGTLVTLLMFVAIIPTATFGGAVAAYLVQKIFFVAAGTFVYLYLFLSVPGTFDVSFGREHHHPAASLAVLLGGAFLLVLVARIFWRQAKKLWAQAKQGGAILSQPSRYLSRVALPSFIGYCFGLGVVAVFLAAYAIPVTFDSIMWVVGSGSLANVASFTPGAIGVTQATNALALKTCCGVSNQTAIAYSTAQQLITSAWNAVLAIALVVWVFGWRGGKELVGGAYSEAKVKAAELKRDRKHKGSDAAAAGGSPPE